MVGVADRRVVVRKVSSKSGDSKRPLAPSAFCAYPCATMTAFLVVLHILVSFFLILFVLLQPGARGGVGAAFGGAGGATVFGGRGANTFLAKLTGASAVVFMLTSIALSYFGSSSTSVMAGRGTPATDTPAATAPADTAPAATNTDGDDVGADDGAGDEAPEGDDAPAGDAPPSP